MNINIIHLIKVIFHKDIKISDKWEFVKWFFNKKKQDFIDYWFGFCSVTRQHIWYENIKKLNTISLIVGRFKHGQFLDNICAEYIPQMIEDIKENKKYYYIHLNQGLGYQEYYLNRFQQKLLLKELEQIMKEEEIYKEEDNE